MKFINDNNVTESMRSFKGALPFDHCLIDDFFKPDIAQKLSEEFLDYDDQRWFYYKNAIEDKKALNDWNRFPRLTYQAFQELMSVELLSIFEETLGCKLYIDHGLHGGGWHIHGSGGNLNPHLDYSIHPKMDKLRKLNIIIYLSKELRPEHGGHLGLWNAGSDGGDLKLMKEIEPKFNRAVLFDTTQNSWHGMSRGLVQPQGIYRKSLAVYYLTQQQKDTDQRQKALFAPREDQIHDSTVKELIKLRADSQNFHKVYREDE
jgi:Rps23 Pro-64 3,4-dihydroxylase Tpa1-like proline 4-hydroxylase